MNMLEQLSKPGAAGLASALTTVGIAFALAQIISGVYIYTFRGLSYSRSFVQALPLGAVITSMLMLAIGDSIAAGIGLAGGLSIIRFRTTMRDPRDMMFVFAGLGAGIACGLGAFPAAIAGTLFFAGSSLLLFFISYGSRRQFDGLVRFVAPADSSTGEAVTAILKRHTRHFVLVTLREAAQGDRMEHAYQIRIPDTEARMGLISDLTDLEDVADISLHMQEPTLEL
jgi:hypothetical protein